MSSALLAARASIGPDATAVEVLSEARNRTCQELADLSRVLRTELDARVSVAADAMRLRRAATAVTAVCHRLELLDDLVRVIEARVSVPPLPSLGEVAP